MSAATISLPTIGTGRFGAYGGRYVPETLMAALEELEAAYAEAQGDRRSMRSWMGCCITTAGGRLRCTMRSG